MHASAEGASQIETFIKKVTLNKNDPSFLASDSVDGYMRIGLNKLLHREKAFIP